MNGPMWASILGVWLVAAATVALLFGAMAAAMGSTAHDEIGHRVVGWVAVALTAGLVVIGALQASGICTCLG